MSDDRRESESTKTLIKSEPYYYTNSEWCSFSESYNEYDIEGTIYYYNDNSYEIKDLY